MKKRSYALLVIAMMTVLTIFTGCSSEAPEEKETESSVEVQEITTEELKENYSDDEWVLVDTRINDAYNGWALDGVARGGHIEGAVDFASNWLAVEADGKDEILEEALSTKGIDSEKNVVLYDAGGEDASAVAEYLGAKGYENLYVYDVNEWAEDESLPMESYENYEMAVPASWVEEEVDSLKVFEVSWGEESEDYNSGHIPGAVHINTDEVEEGPIWNRLSDDKLEKFTLNNGIASDTKVVLYGADSMPAYRVAAILKYIGVEDVRVLNGGYRAWVDAGYDVETDKNEKEKIDSFGAEVPANKDYIVDLPGAKEIIADPEGSVLVDIRSWEEHIGEISGYDYIEAKGRPDGAVWGYAGTDSLNLQDFRNIDGTMKNGYEIEKMWEELGITKDKKLSFFCGTGWRAAEVLLYADIMGFENISLYDGGWKEWSEGENSSENPIASGEPEVKPSDMK